MTIVEQLEGFSSYYQIIGNLESNCATSTVGEQSLYRGFHTSMAFLLQGGQASFDKGYWAQKSYKLIVEPNLT